MTRWPSDDKAGKIRDAALAEFAGRGVEATSLREVAARAGVSVGLIQHHFGTKGDLVDAVNRDVTDLLREVLASGPEPVTVDDFGEQVMQLFTKHTVVADYLARALVDDTSFGAAIFDTLIEMGVARWRRRADAGQTVDGLDVPWAAMNMVVLVIGTVLLRPHVERQLADPLLCPDQLARWGAAVKSLMSRGYLRSGGSGGGGLEQEGGYPAGVGPAKGVPAVPAGARKARTSSTTRTPRVPPVRNR